jgi:hypothetical protein
MLVNYKDIHLDPYYKEGADPDDYCHTYGKKRSKDSGKYGALGTDCDSPKALVDATFAFLKKSINDVDFIIYTGDTVRHVSSANLFRATSFRDTNSSFFNRIVTIIYLELNPTSSTDTSL